MAYPQSAESKTQIEASRHASLYDLLRAHAERRPGAVALLSSGREPLTSGRLLSHVDEVAQALRAHGIARNDRVAMALPSGPEAAVATIAVACAATCAPLNPACRQGEFEFSLTDLNAKALFAPEGSASPAVAAARSLRVPVIEVAPPRAGVAGVFTLGFDGPANLPPDLPAAVPDDIALALHTSGATARPKLAPLTHANICAAAYSIVDALELAETDRCLSVMPLFHIHGLSAIFASLAAGATVVCSGEFSPAGFFHDLEEFRPTWYTAAPAVHQGILDAAPGFPDTIARSRLRFVRSASSAMPRQLLADIERLFRVPFVEAYGMTEAAPQIASNRLPSSERRAGSVGRAAGPEIAVLDPEGRRLPAGEPGEIAVRGPNVIRSYDPPAAGEGAFVDGWLRTGDLGHIDADGFLFITGRLKEVINRGGEKISPREVEEVLLDHPAVAEAAVFPLPHPTLGEGVGTAVVLRRGAVAAEAELRRFVAARLAAFKAPQRVALVDRIPTGPTGKLERLRLGATLGLQSPNGDDAAGSDSADAIQDKVARIWASVLGIERPGPDDDFFRCGGHSLSAMQVVARLRREFGVELESDALFAAPTLAELSGLVARALSPPVRLPAVAAVDGARTAPLSFVQERLWFLDQVEPGNPAYNIASPLWLTGPLDRSALEESLSELQRRHESLRTTFAIAGDQPVQVIAPPSRVPLPVADLTGLPDAEREAAALRYAAEEAARPFDLSAGPLFRARLLRLSPDRHALLLTAHHAVSDGWSTGLMYRELAALYAASLAGRPPALPALPMQYSGYAAWQRETLRGSILDGHLDYWRRQLADPPPALELPADRPRPAVQTFRGARISRTLSSRLTASLKDRSRAENVTLFMTSMAAFQALLLRYSGQEDFLVGIPVANRTRVETEPLIGCFANTLALRAGVAGDPSFRELLARVKAAARGALARQDLPFEKIVETLRPERDPSRMPLFQVMFAFQNVPEPGVESFELAPGLSARPFRVDGGVAKFDLTAYLSEDGHSLSIGWQYNVDLFDAAAIEQLASHFEALLEQVAADPGRRLSEFQLLTEAERRRLETGWSANAQPSLTGGCFHRLFERQAEKTPGATALECGRERLSYADLNAEANRLARRLQSLGIGPEERVGICLQRSASLIVAALAVLKAGGAYVALDPDYPPDRLAFMLDDSRPRVLIAETALLNRLRPSAAVAVVCLDADAGEIARHEPHNLESGAAGENLAYIIYTSGSMGTPKGVMVTHANVYHCASAMAQADAIAPEDRYLHTASFGFSSSVRQFAVPLGCGAALVMAPAGPIRDPRALFELIREQRVSVLDIVPSYWRACIHDLLDLPPASRAALLDNHLRLILSASERLPADLPRAWALDIGHSARMINMYGQTETTGIVTVDPISPPSRGSVTVPVGRPIANTRVYVLDRRGEPAPTGVSGEVFVAGAGVARGYFDRPDLTAAQFPPDPFHRAERMYRTGDLGRFRRDGALELLGRADDQIKIRGYRIEPGEIEVTLRRHSRVRECAVLAQDSDDHLRLVAFVATSEPSAQPDLGRELHALVKSRLPDYMVPAAIVELDALPRTPSGKVDRSALAARLPAVNRGERCAPAEAPPTFREPRTPAERRLAGIWRDVLRVDRVGVDDNFFELGGDSLLSVRMVRQANRAGLAVTLKQLFQHQTVAELARAAGAAEVSLPPEPLTPPRPVLPAPPPDESEPGVYVTIESLRAYGREALERAGLAPEGAAIVTDVQLEASLRGQPTHNMDSIPRYARRIAAGAINGDPRIRIERETRISAQMDGDNGPGQWVAVAAMETAIRKARQSGVGLVSVRRSNHFGAAGHYVWLAAREGLIGLCTTNGPAILAPTGGVTPTFGNNPIGAGIPAGRHHPIVLDIALSVAPRGKIGLRLAEGKPLPPGWILDRFGRPSTDPADLAAGLGVPIGGHKGYGLALVMEALAGALPGAGFGHDHRRERMRDHSELRDLGHFFLAIDPELFSPAAEFTARVDRMIEQAKSAERMEGVAEILVPGEAEMRARERNLERGVPLRPVTYEALLKHAASAGLSVRLDVIESP
ncbi:MAG: amino acid adenylation domain-containing protein [Bryobacteraceae bacterium]|nr:amino acid adenylation domain-containing protein [Bryobacteraceae bacterium]